MLITAVCPACKASYQVQDSLRGKSMRCPQNSCRTVFVVDDRPAPPTPTPTPAPANPGQQGGTVGDLVPLLPVESAEPDPAPEPASRHVSDILEFLPAESAEPAPLPLEFLPPDEPVPAPDWSSPPPVRRSPRTPEAESPEPPSERVKKPAREPSRLVQEQPRPLVFEEGAWQPPPVRRGTEKNGESLPELIPLPDSASSYDLDADAPPPPKRRPAEKDRDRESSPDLEGTPKPPGHWAKWVILPFVVVTAVVLGITGFFVLSSLIQSEKARAASADEIFDNAQNDAAKYGSAKQEYDQLVKRYPSSDEVERYRYRAEMSALLERVTSANEEIGEALDHAEQVLKEQKGKPHLQKDVPLLGKALVKMTVAYARQAATTPRNLEPRKPLARAKTVLGQAQQVKIAKGDAPPPWQEVEEAVAAYEQAIARQKQRDDIVARLAEMASRPSYRAIVDVEARINEVRATFPDLPESEEVRKILEGLYAGHLASARFVEGPAKGIGRGRSLEPGPALVVDPLLEGKERSDTHPFSALALIGPVGAAAVQATLPSPTREGIVLALSRGVLYGLSRADGRVVWARRVGIDTTTLPLRVPARAGSQERLLVLSSDARTLTALDIEGRSLWTYPLESAVLGRPIVVDQRAYLATYEGEVHEIELIQGRVRGRFQLGQRLIQGGTLDPVARRLYFPADDGCVYVLDVAKRRCERILYSKHPAGSLRGEAILVPGQGEDAPGYLILNQATGLDHLRLRVFDMPITRHDAIDRELSPQASMQGWTWFTPYQDSEKMILLSDAGRLGLFGIRQARNRDQALFPLLPGGERDLATLLFPPNSAPPRNRGRAEVVQVQGDDLWVLAWGRLRRLRLAWGTAEGPRLQALWKEPLVVGSPIHASQVVEDRGGTGTSLVLVTRPVNRSSTVVSCVNDETGKLHWQTQLGLICQGEPVKLTPPEGDPAWLACDESGALFSLDPATLGATRETDWLFAGKSTLLAKSLDENPNQPPMVLPTPNGQTAYVLACPGAGNELVVREVSFDVEGKLQVRKRVNGDDFRIGLQAPLAGKPALVGSHLILPCRDGNLYRLKLPLPPDPVDPDAGPAWRSDRATAEAGCFLTAVSEMRFVVTNGARGLATIEWGADANTFRPLPPMRDDPVTLELKDRITGLTRLPGQTPRLVVTDADKGVWMLDVTPSGALEPVRQWDVKGTITTGPFVWQTKAGTRIGVIVDRSRLVWLAPEAEGVAWTYATPEDNPIIGQPSLVDDRLIVADQSGLYATVDLLSGNKLANGHQLRGSIAPATSPVPFQGDRLLAPLSDGTLLLLEKPWLKKPG